MADLSAIEEFSIIIYREIVIIKDQRQTLHESFVTKLNDLWYETCRSFRG